MYTVHFTLTPDERERFLSFLTTVASSERLEADILLPRPVAMYEGTKLVIVISNSWGQGSFVGGEFIHLPLPSSSVAISKRARVLISIAHAVYVQDVHDRMEEFIQVFQKLLRHVTVACAFEVLGALKDAGLDFIDPHTLRLDESGMPIILPNNDREAIRITRRGERYEIA